MKINSKIFAVALLGIAAFLGLMPTNTAGASSPDPAALELDTVAALAAPPLFDGIEAVDSVAFDPDSVTAEYLFMIAPVEIVPTIDEITRLDMLDYFKAGMDHPSKNVFGKDVRITSLSDDQITFTTSAVGERTISIINNGKGERDVMVINTVKTPQEDSTVKFYNLDWTPSRKGYFMVPTLSDWILPEAKKRKSDLENAVPIMLAKMIYKPSTGELILTNNLGSYLPEEVTDLVGSSLRGSLTYQLTGKGFKLKK
ncbi:MAG: DUF3256 family protein [Muribaculaceae bacterium]|nr:DUF3256 family protein [Muribaculaceae bacterium]